MKVRRIRESDIPKILEVAKRCYDEMDFDKFGYRYDPVQIELSWRRGVDGQGLRGYCTDMVDGLFLCHVSNNTPYFANGPKFAQEIVFHADPILHPISKVKVMKALLAYVLEDLRIIGVNALYVQSDDRYGAVSNLIQKQGGKPMSVSHYMEV